MSLQKSQVFHQIYSRFSFNGKIRKFIKLHFWYNNLLAYNIILFSGYITNVSEEFSTSIFTVYNSFTLKIEIGSSFETFVRVYKTVQWHISADGALDF
jgi:hypothetical protein